MNIIKCYLRETEKYINEDFNSLYLSYVLYHLSNDEVVILKKELFPNPEERPSDSQMRVKADDIFYGK